jgi:aminomethyltransferase
MGDAGVSVVAGDAPGGEESYEVICAADDAGEVWMTLLSRGNGAAPFGYRTYETLTLEAGTPLFDPDIRGESPESTGLARVAGVGETTEEPSHRLVGLRIDAADDDRIPGSGAAVLGSDAPIGRVTRAGWSPSLSEPIAFARIDRDASVRAVRTDRGEVRATRSSLPFVEGGEQSGRLPSY